MALESAVSFVAGKLGDFLIQKGIQLGEVRYDVESMERELRRMQCFLKDADAKRKGDERVRNWVREVRDAAYDAEDVIDNFIVQITKSRQMGLAGNLSRCLYFSSQLKIRHKTANEIKQIKQRMCEISESKSRYGIEDLGSSAEGTQYISESLREQRRSRPFVDEPDVIGFAKDVEMLIAQLKELGTPRRVISIVGMGGSGKTTLAMKVYNSDDVTRHFDCRAWVYVSQEYKVRELLQEIGKKIGLQIDDMAKMNDEDLKEKLFQFLSERRYLIVMDDVWRTEVWIHMRAAFPDVKNGSRIIFTTRNKEVASHADPRNPPHELRLLDEDESWSLFSKKVFAVGNVENCSTEMERTGRDIAGKCGGLPLAIVVLGGLLSRKEKTQNEWLKVLGSVHDQLNRDPENFQGILALSYNDLPYYLKSCFLYFGVFPEDAEIKVRKLIHLWVAEGFIQQGQGDKTIEEAGEDYLEELLDRNMIQLAQRRSDGRPKTCRIHDLLRDLAISKCKEDQFLHVQIDAGVSSLLPKARRIGIHCGIDRYVSPSQSTPHLRSFLVYSRPTGLGAKKLKFLLGGFRLLRVLDLGVVSLSNLPGEIGELIHLRYLRLRIRSPNEGIDCLRFWPLSRLTLPSSIERFSPFSSWTHPSSIGRFWPFSRLALPSSIGNLENLQTLDIRGFYSYQLPNAIWKMKQLRHLYIGPVLAMKEPLRVDLSENLQSLIGVPAGRWIQRLGKLTNLRRLGVIGHLSFYEKELSDSIAHLGALRTLSFRTWPQQKIPALPTLSHHLWLYKIHLNGNMEKLLDWCISPPNLTKLTLESARLEEDPMTTLERLPNLQILRLLQCSYVGKKMDCSTGGFPRLEVLELSDLDELEEMSVDQGSMPSLRRLIIYFCAKLKMLPEGLKHVKTLHELTLDRMDNKFCSRLQENEGEDWHKIQHIPSISLRVPCERP